MENKDNVQVQELDPEQLAAASGGTDTGFVCSKCGRVFEDATLYQEHVNSTHFRIMPAQEMFSR